MLAYCFNAVEWDFYDGRTRIKGFKSNLIVGPLMAIQKRLCLSEAILGTVI